MVQQLEWFLCNWAQWQGVGVFCGARLVPHWCSECFEREGICFYIKSHSSTGETSPLNVNTVNTAVLIPLFWYFGIARVTSRSCCTSCWSVLLHCSALRAVLVEPGAIIRLCRAAMLNPQIWESAGCGAASGCFLQGIRFDGDSWKAKVLTFERMECRRGLSLPNTQLVHVRGKNSNPFLCACFFSLPFISYFFPLLKIPILI